MSLQTKTAATRILLVAIFGFRGGGFVQKRLQPKMVVDIVDIAIAITAAIVVHTVGQTVVTASATTAHACIGGNFQTPGPQKPKTAVCKLDVASALLQYPFFQNRAAVKSPVE